MKKTRVLALVFLGALMASCRSQEGVHVVIEGDGLSVGTDVNRLTLTAKQQRDAQLVLDDTVTLDDGFTLPYLWNVVAGPKTPNGTTIDVSATAWLNSERVATATGTAQMKPGKGAALTLTLSPPSLMMDFSSSPQTLPVGVCSSAFEVNISNAREEITLMLSAQSGVRFFSDSNCQNEISSVNVALGDIKGRFWVRATSVGQYTVEVASNGITVQQILKIEASPSSSLLFLTSSQVVRADECSHAVQLQLTNSQGLLLTPSTDIPLSLVAEQTGVSVMLYADSQCSHPLTVPMFTSSNPKVSAYFKGTVGGQASLFATAAGFSSVRQDHTILPLVRRGQCEMAQGASFLDCGFAPSLVKLENAFLIFQVTHQEATSTAAVVQCRLNAVNQIRCERTSPGEPVTVYWQVVEKPDIEVQHVPFACTAGSVVNVSLAPTTVQAESFVLVSHSGPTVELDGDDFVSVQWRNANALLVLFGSVEGCVGRTGHAQVIRWPQASVARATLSAIPNNVSTQTVNNLPVADVERSFLLYGFHRSGKSKGVCRSVFRGTLDASNVRFFRGGQNAQCVQSVPDAQGVVEGMVFERVTLPFGSKVQSVPVTMPASTTSLNLSLNDVEPSRTVVLTGGQAQSGQGGGESEHSTQDELGDAQVRTVLTTPTQVSVTRGQATAAAAFEVFVIQF